MVDGGEDGSEGTGLRGQKQRVDLRLSRDRSHLHYLIVQRQLGLHESNHTYSINSVSGHSSHTDISQRFDK